MSARIYLLAGTVLAVIVAMGTVLVLSAHTTERPLVALDVAGTGPQAAVLVATRTLPAGSTISAASARSLFAAVQVPAAAAPATAFSSPDQLVGVLRFGSRRTIGTLSRGQVLLASMLSGLVYPQMGSALANALPPNTVATTLAVPPLDAVNGAIA
ncbi:MAG TPA: SAF domain-containing protein, partial [Chloroflexota bacterium]|nr:SAF domain-containing protein [Chloroflexota bacterium]